MGGVQSIKKGDEITLFFAPASSSGGTATFPSWRVKVVDVNDEGVVVDLAGKVIALSWDHVAGFQFMKKEG
jgi:hypothetical protein